jgi:arginase
MPRRPVRLILVPYLNGNPTRGAALGPAALAPSMQEELDVAEVVTIERGEGIDDEAAASFDINRSLAAAVAAAAGDGHLPVVLTGNCHSQQGVLAGLAPARPDLAWLDCHPDFNTPDTTSSGFFDGYGLAMCTGRCWRTLCAGVPGHRDVEDERVLLIGARDIDPGEDALLEESAIVQIPPERIDEAGAAAEALGSAALSVHLDLDVLEPSEARANHFTISPGISGEELQTAIAGLLAAAPTAAFTFSAYDPAVDPDGKVVDIARNVAKLLSGEG